MAGIYEAIYKGEDGEELIDIDSVTPTNYLEKYRENLYCTTTNCSAQLAYVHKDNDSNHFRTWRDSKHIETCLFYFKKIATRERNRTDGQVNGIASDEKIKQSLKDAFLLEMMSEEQKKKQRERERARRQRKRERDRTPGGIEKKPAQKIVSNPDEINGTLESNGTRLYKRSADALKEKDLGNTRTVTGQLKKVWINSIENVVVEVEKNKVQVDIKFEEAFFAANQNYKGMFHYLERYLNEYQNLSFSATGEVRFSKTNNRYEIVVFNGIGFLIHGKTLSAIAVEYSLKDNDGEN
ncbi:hypothetical protein [Bacillus cereus]|uniref:hypothetical protein n=1 Tax=Bacillus cereus TaxID=1396 RepID=UPI000BF5331F|nr:hypothetical protein [Bacillus cereus]MEB9368437.1 hypothetical protein [Bacillus cereus]PES56725.1 hypothetical protein CN515_03300 [Bacillus cereus]PFI05929.1 hypothetical protein COI67_26895 [Bacillus cereus]PGM26923.1 hypothetical protein CN940_03300 [Bacillus cereus]PGQ53113.1 hypothetical protein COA22_18085 [Bacillus cereus]